MRIFITGISGFLGTALREHLRGETLAGLTRDEHKLDEITREVPVQMFLGDLTHWGDVRDALQEFNPHLVIHAGALKVVPHSELYPERYIRTNIQGSLNVARAVQEIDSHAVLISSDKACAPHNLYGVTKRAAEKVFLRRRQTVVRYGNVFGATGSVYPLWKDLAERGEPITITSRDMTRFYVGRQEAVDFVMARAMDPGLWVPTLPAYGMGDFLKAFMLVHGEQEVQDIPVRAGEKMHEVLISRDELPDARQRDGAFLISPYVEGKLEEPFSSDRADRMSVDEIANVMETFNG